MTRAEAIQTLQANTKLLHFEHPHLGIKEAIEVVIEALSRTSPPSNLDEAAEEYVKDYGYTEDDYKRERIIAQEHFKSGAEWMAGQGITFKGKASRRYENGLAGFVSWILFDQQKAANLLVNQGEEADVINGLLCVC